MVFTSESGKTNDADHSLTCSLGSFVTKRHSVVSDFEAGFLRSVGKDVQIAPALIPLVGNENLERGSSVKNNARLKLASRGLWENELKFLLIFNLGTRLPQIAEQKVRLSAIT